MRTQPNREKGVWLLLTAVRGCEVYLPLYQQPSSRKDRNRVLSIPLIPGYVFARFDWVARGTIFRTFGLIDSAPIVLVGKEPGKILDSELNHLRDLVDAGASPYSGLTPGAKVEVDIGDRICSGVLIEIQDRRTLIVDVTFSAFGKMATVAIPVDYDRVRKVA